MRAFGLACLGLVVGLLAGLAASEVIGIIGVVLFDRHIGIRFLPIVLGIALATGLPLLTKGGGADERVDRRIVLLSWPGGVGATWWHTGPVAHTPDPDVLVSSLLLPGEGDSAHAVRCVGFSKNLPTPIRRRELPSAYLTMVVGLGDPLVLVGRREGGERRVSSFVAGLQQESAITERHGQQRGVHVELPPLAAYTLFGLPICELTDELVDLPTVLGDDSARLVEALASAEGWRDAFHALRVALVGRMVAGPQPTPAVAWLSRQLHATHGSARIDQLVERSGVSHRHLASRFREQVGMTPKAYGRVLRFERSLTLLRRDGASLASVAAAAGYYDQAHLHREFRTLAAQSPRTFLADRPAAAAPEPPRSSLSKTRLAGSA